MSGAESARTRDHGAARYPDGWAASERCDEGRIDRHEWMVKMKEGCCAPGRGRPQGGAAPSGPGGR